MIYLASPYFTESQKERLDRIKAILDEYEIKYISPVEEYCVTDEDTTKKMREIFKKNCDAIEKCYALIAVTDEKDMGTIWEAGYARRSLKPIVYFAETLGDNPFNLMLAFSGKRVCTSIKQLKKAMYEYKQLGWIKHVDYRPKSIE